MLFGITGNLQITNKTLPKFYIIVFERVENVPGKDPACYFFSPIYTMLSEALYTERIEKGLPSSINAQQTLSKLFFF